PARLVTVALRDTHLDASHVQRVLSYPIYQDLRRSRDVFTSVGIDRSLTVDLGSGAQVKSLIANLVNADYFTALGVRPLIGRFFNADEAGDVSNAPVAVLGFGFWQREFAGDASIIGRTVQVAGAPHSVIGIAPEGFQGVGLTEVDVWLPLTDGLDPATIAGLAKGRQTYAYTLVARLAPSVTMTQ